ncbi:hypothetical protein [Melittangium boletus]|uniref:hypothetical protein n=1 Tax=Melittangium boletus TaxID=83453 RepID=UPI003DA6BE2D
MSPRGVGLQGVLAALALGAALLVSLRAPPGAPGEVTVLDAAARDLRRVRLETAAGPVELFRAPGAGDTPWLRLGAREVRGNGDAARLFTRFAPLRAARDLGVLDAEHLAEVGLTASTERLRLSLTQGEQLFRLAAPVSGWRGPYLLRESDGHVFLLSASLLPDLEHAAHRLVERALHAFGPGDYDTLTLTMEARTRAFRLVPREDRPVELVPVAPPGAAPEEAARRWHERLTLLAPAAGDFLGRDEAPADGPLAAAFRVDYGRGGARVGFLEVARSAAGVHYLRTEHTPGWVRLAPWADSLAEEARRGVLTPPPPPP